MKNPQCPRCSSDSDVTKHKLEKRSNNRRVQRYLCHTCQSSFQLESLARVALPAEEICPHCGSDYSVKWGKPRAIKYGQTQRCLCKDCGRQFTKGVGQPLRFYLNGKFIYTFMSPPGIKQVANHACLNCGQEKVVYGRRYFNKHMQRQICEKVCLGCGQKFTGVQNRWNTATQRRLGKEVPQKLWNFQEDTWDFRALYPNFDTNKVDQIFLYFSSCGDDWFKDLVKHYVLALIKRGMAFGTVTGTLFRLRHFGRYLQAKSISQMNEINREFMGVYWSQERGHLKSISLSGYQTSLRLFLQWGNRENHFRTNSNLVSSLFDRPKAFYSEPDPLEDDVLQAIRDNVHLLPEPLQLQFILGAWLGTRPGELCRLKKNCIVQEPDSWWLEFDRDKTSDEHKLPLPKDLIQLIAQQQAYITDLFGKDYPYLFCHYQNIRVKDFPQYLRLKPIERPPMTTASSNPMVKAIRQLIKTATSEIVMAVWLTSQVLFCARLEPLN